jgi:hypothetical protein
MPGGVGYWNINAERHGPDALVFTIGWRHFVIENALLRGTRLCLRYRGNGNFWEIVWDRDGLCIAVARQLLTRTQ